MPLRRSQTLDFTIGDGETAQSIGVTAIERARQAGRPLLVRIFDATTRRDLMVHPDGHIDHRGDHPLTRSDDTPPSAEQEPDRRHPTTTNTHNRSTILVPVRASPRHPYRRKLLL